MHTSPTNTTGLEEPKPMYHMCTAAQPMSKENRFVHENLKKAKFRQEHHRAQVDSHSVLKNAEEGEKAVSGFDGRSLERIDIEPTKSAVEDFEHLLLEQKKKAREGQD
ncbi:hypothetical protein RUND412_008653 [Rhizina undulata]